MTAFGDNQPTSVADSAQVCSDGPDWLRLLAAYLLRPSQELHFFSSFGHIGRPKNQKHIL